MSGARLSSIVRFAFDACHRLRETTTVEEASLQFVQEMGWLGFDKLTCAGAPVPGLDTSVTVLLNTRPQAYTDRYVEQGHAFRDPVVTELRRSLTTYSWSDVRQRRSLTRDERNIMEEGREVGMCDGLVIPVVTTTGSLALVLPCGRNPDLSAPARSAAELVGMTGYQALKRLHLLKARIEENTPERLTPREREILQWLLVGKTDDEVGEILTISRSTVRHHVESAKRKLDTHSRPFALAEALRRGEIAL